MNYPSVKKIAAELTNGDVEKAKAIRGKMILMDNPERVLEQVNVILNTYGVEMIHLKKAGRIYYCNTGESYSTTLMYFEDERRFRVGNWGSWAERDRDESAD